jgi:hypothetical protein
LGKYLIEQAMGKTGDGGYNSSPSRVCTLALLIVTAKAILIENHLLHSLKSIVGSDERN